MANKFEETSSTTREFPLEFLQQITNNFSDEHIIGHGGYGIVYKGVLENGEEIALKKLHHMPGLDDKQFRNEFNHLMRVQHRNITRLVGYCYNLGHQRFKYGGEYIFALVEERVLCLEYLQGGSLDKHISDESCGLDWQTRFNIIRGVCDGLNYLHNGTKDHIYHLDLKPANILLDENMVPKIGDFGLSRLFPLTKTYITIKVIGTLGYMPPEYIERNEITSKYDVFSLGVIIMRIMAGDDGYYKCAHVSSQEFLEHVHANWEKRLQETMSSHISEQVKTCIKISLRCVEVNRDKRPTIAEIVDELNKVDLAGSSYIGQETAANPPPPAAAVSQQLAFNQDTLQQRLQAIIEGSRETWTYAIFWQSSTDAGAGASLLGWGNGYYKGCEEADKRRQQPTPASAAEQEHRKRALRELNSLIAGGGAAAPDESIEEEVTDTEWFFLVSLTQSFPNGMGLPGQTLYARQPTWIANGLASAPCKRARQAYTFGLRTMVCLPVGTGVLELGATEVIFQTADSLGRIRSLFNLNGGGGGGSGSWPPVVAPPPQGGDQAETDPSVLWLTDALVGDMKESPPSIEISVSKPPPPPQPSQIHHFENGSTSTLTENLGPSVHQQQPPPPQAAQRQNQRHLQHQHTTTSAHNTSNPAYREEIEIANLLFRLGQWRS